MPTLPEVTLQNFAGLNRRSDRLNSPPIYLWDLQNFYVKKDYKSNQGILVERDGTVKFNAFAIGSDSFLSHGNGADAATTLNAETGQVITFVGDAQLDTAQKKFGSASFLFDGTGDRISIPDSIDWYYATLPMTLEYQVRFASLPSTTTKIATLYEQRDDASNYVQLAVNASNRIIFKVVSAGVTLADYSYTWSPSINTWYHIRVVRNGANLYLFIAGVLTAWTTTATAIDADTSFPDLAAVVTMGGSAAGNDLNGWIDEPRISRGAARSTATFTDPAGEFTATDYGYGTTTRKIRNLFEAKWYGGTTDVIIRAGGAWAKYDGSSAFASFSTGRSNDVVGQCAMFKNSFLFVDGGIPQKMSAAYSVTDLSADANMPQDSTAVWIHRDKIWLNSTATPMKAYFSKTNAGTGATDWTGTTDAGTIDLSTVLPEGDTILGFRTYGSQDSGLIAIICSKYTVIYKAGANVYDFTFVQYFPTTCISINSAAYIGNEIVYPSRNTFTSLKATVASDNVDVNTLSSFIEDLYRESVASVSTTSEIQGFYDRKLNLFYVMFPGTSPVILVYSVDIKNFVGRWTYPWTMYCGMSRLSGVALAGSENYVYTMNSGNADDGEAIDSKVSFMALYFGAISYVKKPIEFEALFKASGNQAIYIDYWYSIDSIPADLQTLTCDLSYNSSLWDVALWDVGMWFTSANTLFRSSDMLGRGRQLFIDIRKEVAETNLIIPYITVRYKMEGRN